MIIGILWALINKYLHVLIPLMMMHVTKKKTKLHAGNFC